MPNVAAVVAQAAKDVMYHVSNEMSFLKVVDRNKEDKFNPRTPSGGTYTFRIAARPSMSNSFTYAPQDLVEESVIMTQAVPLSGAVAFPITDTQQVFEVLDEDRVIKPFANSIVSSIESYLASLYTSIPYVVGTAGTNPSSLALLAAARNSIIKQGGSQNSSDFNLVTSLETQSSLISGQSALFNNSAIISKQFITGQYASGVAGIGTMLASPLIATHTAGVQGGTPVVAGAAQTGATINISGASNSITNWGRKGDVVTFAGCFDINPINRSTVYTTLKQFVLTADVNSSGTGTVALPISPAIVTSGALQNCSASPTNSGAVTFLTGGSNQTSSQSILFSKGAIQFVSAKMGYSVGPLSKAADFDGISIRLIVAEAPTSSGETILRLDGMFGAAVVRPSLCCRILGA